MLSLIFFRVPGGVLLHHGDKALVYAYYGVLVDVVVFGIAEAFTTFGIPGESDGRHTIEVIVLWFSLLLVVIIVALGGFSSAPPK